MSTSSFDDSSNLVDKVIPANGEQKEDSASGGDTHPDLLSFDEPDDLKLDSKGHDSKHKSKKTIAKKLFKRAKSPISGAINKTTKEFKKLSNLPKHHHSSQKSPQKSPSKENLTEEYSRLEQKLSEKKSEEWLAFQQMQERVQQAVSKTQSKLQKYSSQDAEDLKLTVNISTRWTGFEEGTLEPEVIDTSLNPSISITCPATDSDKADLLGTDSDIPNTDNLVAVSTQSPPICPGPPHNSRIASMENLSEEDSAQNAGMAKTDELDFFGFGSSAPAAPNDNGSSDLLADDLSDFDSLSSTRAAVQSVTPVTTSLEATEPVQIVPTAPAVDPSDVLGGYSFSASVSDSTTSVGQQENKTVDNDILMFEKPVDEFANSIAAVQQTVTESAVSQIPQSAGSSVPKHDDDVNVEMQGAEFEPQPSVSSSVSQPIMPEPLPRDSSSDIVKETKRNPSLDIFGEPLKPMPAMTATKVPKDVSQTSFETQPAPSSSVLDEFASFDPIKGGFGAMPAAPTEDIFTKIKKLAPSSQPMSPARLEGKKKSADHFSFVKKALVGDKYDDDDGYKPLTALNKNKPEPVQTEIKETEKHEDLPVAMDTSKNPFMSSSFTEESQSMEAFSSSNAAALFGLEPQPMDQLDTGFDEFGASDKVDADNENKPSWMQPGAFDQTDFDMNMDEDEAWGDDEKTETKPTGDVWGGDMAMGVSSPEAKLDADANPFQDDFSKLDEVPAEKQLPVSGANPFMAGNALMDAPLIASSAPSNPFLDTGTLTAVGTDLIGDASTAVVDLFGDPVTTSSQVEETTTASSDLLDVGGQTGMLSESESFFLDSVADEGKKEDLPKASGDDDLFDPFKVSGTGTETDADAKVDEFTKAAALGDKQLAKPSGDDDHSFILDINPFHSGSLSDKYLCISEGLISY